MTLKLGPEAGKGEVRGYIWARLFQAVEQREQRPWRGRAPTPEGGGQDADEGTVRQGRCFSSEFCQGPLGGMGQRRNVFRPSSAYHHALGCCLDRKWGRQEYQ